MSTYVRTLKEKTTDDTVYPVTKAGAVYMEDEESTVEDEISTLNSNMAASTSELSIESGWTATAKWCRKRAGVVEFYMEVTGGTLSSGWNTIGTLPSRYTPAGAFDFNGVDNGASTTANGVQSKVTSAGLVQVYKSSGMTNNLRLHATFLT